MTPERFFALSLGLGALLLAAHYAISAHSPLLPTMLGAPVQIFAPDGLPHR